jgi:hypothetical protein
VSFESSPGISVGPPLLISGYPKAGEVAGFANFGVLKAQAYASNNGTVINTQSLTNVNTTFSGTVTGSTPGTIARFNISLRVDGTLNSGAAIGDNTGSVDVDASLKILDKGNPNLCGEGCAPLVELGAMANSTAYGTTGTTFNSWNWDLQSRDLMGALIDDLSDSNSWDVGPGSTCLPGPGNNFCLNDIIFDTGILSATFETTVGATLDFDASLYIFAQGTSFDTNDLDGTGAYGSADFYDTFGLAITPLTEGVELDFGDITLAPFNPGSPVPVPTAVWLFGSGLMGLIGVARRKKA